MALIPPCKIGTKFASINNKLIAPEFHIPSSWGIQVRWANMEMRQLGGGPSGVPTAQADSSKYSTTLWWPPDRIEWNSTGIPFYNGIFTSTGANQYYNLYHFGSYYEYPVGFEIDYSGHDSAGYTHALPTSLDFHWSGGGGYGMDGTFYVQLGEDGKAAAYLMTPLYNWEQFRIAGTLHDYSAHIDLVYPTGW